MTLWRRTAGALKDKNSIWLASMARRTSYRHPELEAAIIKATSHDEEHVDYRNAQRVFQWLRTSPAYLRPLVWSLARRMRRTRSWVVALKGLMLMHGVFCCNTPNVRCIGRLPFDLSNFLDAHSNPAAAWPHSTFVRLYFAFLDQRAVYFCSQQSSNHPHHHHHHPQQQNHDQEEEEEQGGGGGDEEEEEGKKEDRSSSTFVPIGQELVRVQKWQTLLDLLLQIKPHRGMEAGDLILEAMDCVIIEIFDIYSSICNGIARVLARIYAARAFEASIALRVLKKATVQIEKLTTYFQFCTEIGVLSSSELPKVDQIPEEDIRQLQRIVAEVSHKDGDGDANNQAMVVVKPPPPPPQISIHDGAVGRHQVLNMNNTDLKTVITDKWEVFEDDQQHQRGMVAVGNSTNLPFQRGTEQPLPLPLPLPAAPWDSPPLIYMDDLPDLISL